MDRGRGGHRHSAVLQAHHHAVDGAGTVDHGHAGKPRPARLKEKTSPRLRRSRHAIDENSNGGDRAGDFQGTGAGPLSAVRKSSRAPSGGNRMCSFACASPARSPGAKCRSGGGSLALVVTSTPEGARGSRAGAVGRPRKLKEDRRRSYAPDETRHRRAVRPPNPDADGVFAVEPDRPGVAVAVAGAGLERDTPGRAVFRRRRPDQDVADIPGRDRLQEARAPCARAGAGSGRSSNGNTVPRRAIPA